MDDTEGMLNVIGSSRDRAARGDPGQHPHQGADQASEEAIEEVLRAQDDPEPDRQIMENLHSLPSKPQNAARQVYPEQDDEESVDQQARGAGRAQDFNRVLGFDHVQEK